MTEGLRTGEVAERAGVNIQTLRYYERRGLLAEPARSNGGHRVYPADTVALLTVIKAAKRLGFTLDEVAELLDAGSRRHPTADLRQRAIDKITEIDRRIADLTAVRATLTEVVDARCDSLTDCTCADCPIPYLTIGTTTATAWREPSAVPALLAPRPQRSLGSAAASPEREERGAVTGRPRRTCSARRSSAVVPGVSATRRSSRRTACREPDSPA